MRPTVVLAALVAAAAVAAPAAAAAGGVFHGSDGQRQQLEAAPAGLWVEQAPAVREGVACFQAWRADEAGRVSPALGVKYVLDERRRVFSVSGRLCTAAGWETVRVVWRNTVKSLPVSPGTPAKGTNPEAYTVWFVEQALARYERDGLQATVDYYNTPGSVDGQWYVFIGDEESNTVIANAGAPALVGLTADQVRGQNGYPIGEIIAAVAEEDGAWLDYIFTNPVSGSVETKHSWLVTRDGLLFGSGWYESGPFKSDPPGYTQALVEQAVILYEALGPGRAFGYYNSPEALDGPWYVFAIEDRDGALYSVANSNRPELVGTVPDRVDASGFDYGAAFAETPDGEGQWVSYLFTHPVTRQDAPKHTWIVRRGDFLFGAGWYEGIG